MSGTKKCHDFKKINNIEEKDQVNDLHLRNFLKKCNQDTPPARYGLFIAVLIHILSKNIIITSAIFHALQSG